MPPTRAERTHAQNARTEELQGKFESCRFKASDSGFIIGYLDDGSCVMGDAGETGLIPGMEYRFHGKWEDSSYGRQFKFRAFVQAEPLSRHGVVEYLRRLCPGVGDMIANKLCDLYGSSNAIAMLKTQPEQVAAAVGKRFPVDKAIESARVLIREQKWQQTKVELLEILAGNGFRHECIERAIKKWGVHAPRRVRRDPFCLLLADMPGAGFMTCDKLYHKLGLPSDRTKRQVVCLWHILKTESDGSTWMKRSSAAGKMGEKITGRLKVDRAVRFARKLGLVEEREIGGELWLSDSKVADDERVIAKKIFEVVL